tara:strand:+ start:2276 stop:2725 length:450 start_codon:yes stop_codon:yes gene_type:complete
MPRMNNEKWNEFLKRIGEGRSARDVCGNDKDMPSWRTVSIKLNEDVEFSQKYSLAMENRGQVYADKISEIVNKVVDGLIDPNAGRVAIDGLKWMSMKLAPKKFGDIHRMEVKHETSYVDALKEVSGMIDSTTSNTLRTHEETEENKTIQ